MTDNYITEITTAMVHMADELKAMRREMPSKEDVTAIFGNFATEWPSRLERLIVERSAELPATNPPVPGLQERFETVTGKLLDRIEDLEENLLAAVERIERLEWLLRPAETGETRTRLDAGASSESVGCMLCPRGAVPGTNLCAFHTPNYWGGSGNQPAAPSTDSSGTEQRQTANADNPAFEDYGEYKDTKGF